MAEISKLKQQRARVKSQLTRMENSLRDSENVSPAEAQVRLNKLEQIMETFNDIQIEIEEKMQATDELTEGLTEEQLLNANEETERQLFENRYYAAAVIAQQIVNVEQSIQQGARSQANQSNRQQD